MIDIKAHTKLRPLLTATHRYDKSLSTHNRGRGQIIEAPILAYLIETSQGRILYDVGCDYQKIVDKSLRERYYNENTFSFGAPQMEDGQRIGRHLERLGLKPDDIDVIFLGHLHFDHAGGLQELRGPEVHVQHAEMQAARSGTDVAYFADDFAGHHDWKMKEGEYEIVAGIRAVSTPGHTAGHMSLWVELPKGQPVILCGDAADLEENLQDEIAPGILWENREDLATESIRKLKALAQREDAVLWPNHDMAFWKGLQADPAYCEKRHAHRRR